MKCRDEKMGVRKIQLRNTEWKWIQLALGLFQTDLAIKHEMDDNPEFEKEHLLLDGAVRVKRHRNSGMAGGRFAGHTQGIIRCSVAAAFGCTGMFLSLLMKRGHEIQKLGFALLTGGAFSNLYDRCRKGYVVDYVSFHTPFQRLNRLVFNLSDFFILAGALLICFGQTDKKAE